MPRATDAESARARAAAKPGLDPPRIPRPPAQKRREERGAAAGPRGSALLPGSRLRPPARNGQGQARTRPAGRGGRGNGFPRAPSISLRPTHATAAAPEDVTSGSPLRKRPAKRTGSRDRLTGLADLINPRSLEASFQETLPRCPPLPCAGLPGAPGGRGPGSPLGSPPAAPSPFPTLGPHVSLPGLFFMAKPPITCPFAQPPPTD